MTAYNKRNVQQINNSEVAGNDWTGGGAGGSTVNKGGTILRGGNIPANNNGNFQASAIAPNVAVTGPIVYLSDENAIPLVGGNFTARNITFKALSGGNFASMTTQKYVGVKLATQLAGVANTTLLSAAADFGNRNSIHRTEAWRTSFLSSFTWAGSGATIESPGSNMPVYTFVYSNNLTSNGQNSAATNPASQGTNDIASRPTLAIPGQLVYRSGRPLPVLDLYKAKTNG